jgi:vancomycin aglycone glucosyltransferase
MKVVLVGYGSRGDVEPCAAVGRELLRRGHQVCMAVPPNMVGFVASAGLVAVAYGPDSRAELDPAADLVTDLATRGGNLVTVLSEVTERVSRVKADKTATLAPLADGADLLVAGFNEQGLAANVAEYHGIPLAVLHFFPKRVWSSGGLYADITKQTDDAQRRELGLQEADGASASLQIQAYDALCLPGPAEEWLEPDGPRTFVGALTLELPTGADDAVLLWIAAGTPPIYFGFGSTPLASPAETVAVIDAACAQLGERGLICTGPNDVDGIRTSERVTVVDAVNHAAVFPACRAVVHHGGAGATAAGLRAGMPTLILWLWLDQPVWAAGVTRLEVGSGRAFSESTLDSLVADLRRILSPQCVDRAREVAALMTKPADAVARAADLLEALAR